jgi:hypothetical protein
VSDDEEVVCRDLNGVRRRVRLTDRAGFASPGSMLHQRLVVGPHDIDYLRKSVPPDAGQRDPRLYDLLDHEIRTVAHLTRAFGGRAAEVPSLVGYNMDVAEPFVLLRPYAGQPAPDVVRGLSPEQRRPLRIGLLRALHVIGGAGVVHGALSLDALRWTGTGVQLVDFEWAQRVGESRRPGAGPRQSPERMYGTGPADPRDDIWSAGVLIRELIIGPQAIAAPDDQSGDPERLKQDLHDVFGSVELRPFADELLKRMRVDAAPVHPADPATGLADGHRRFEEACRRKGAGAPVVPQQQTSRRDARTLWRRLLSPGLLAILAAATGVR